MNKLHLLIAILILPLFVACQKQFPSQKQLRDSVLVKFDIFTVMYSEKLEQPLWLEYRSINRQTLVNRGNMTFYLESGVKTSDDLDYANNIYDKGHLAPAATFSDNMINLKQTFTYLNCALQNQYLNRGEWRLLEEQERLWDDKESLTVFIKILFDNTSVKLSTGATVPSQFEKHIYFEQSNIWKCYSFPNTRPSISWKNSIMVCYKHK